MPVADLTELTRQPAPFTTVVLDASRTDRAGGDDARQRWLPHATRLLDAGADEHLVDEIGELAGEPTNRGGELTRVVVASAEQVALDVLLPGRPARDESTFALVPQLMPLLRGTSGAVRYLVVRLDRAGADLELIGPLGESDSEQQVEGGHDVLHKVRGGGLSHRRLQSRVEDSEERNAAAVAEKVNSVVRRFRPDLVLVGGDHQARTALNDYLDGAAAPLVVPVNTVSRNAGAPAPAQEAAIETALAEFRAAARRRAIEEFTEQISRQQRAVESLESVVDALRRGQVQLLLLNDDPTSTLTLWVGEQPLHLGLTEQDSREAGAQAPAEVRADAAIAWAAIGSDADVLLVPTDELELTGGVGAVLRWADRATAHDRVPSMPGHGELPAAPASEHEDD